MKIYYFCIGEKQKMLFFEKEVFMEKIYIQSSQKVS